MLGEGLSKSQARALAAALNYGDYFACTRSAHLPPGIEKIAVYGGYALTPEEIAKAKGKP